MNEKLQDESLYEGPSFENIVIYPIYFPPSSVNFYSRLAFTRV